MDAVKNISHCISLSLSHSNTHFKQLSQHRKSAVSILENTLYNLYITYNIHFNKQRLQVFFLSIEKISNFSCCNGIPELYQLYQQIRHSFHSPSYQTDGAVRRFIHTITLSHIMNYGVSTRKQFDSHTAQIRYQDVSLQWFCNNSYYMPCTTVCFWNNSCLKAVFIIK